MRKLIVLRCFREHAYVPMVRLRGLWLQHAGFQEGMHVQVQVERGKLTLTIEQVVAEAE